MGTVSDTLTLYKREMIIFFGNIKQNMARATIFPFLIILVFGTLGNTATHVPIAIVNYANNPASVQFISDLGGQSVSVKGVTSQQNAEAMLKSGEVDMMVIISPSFPLNSNGNPSVMIYYTTSQFSSLSAIPFIESTASSMGAGASKVQQQADVVATPSFAAKGSYTTFLVGGVIIMAVAMAAMFSGGISIITDRLSGNLKTFFIAPIDKISIVLSKILSGASQAMISAIVAIVIGLVFGAKIAMGAYGLAWILLLSALVAVGLGSITIILTSFVDRIEVYALMSQAVTLPLWFLAGAFFPTSALPSWLYPISVIDPLTYAINGIRYVMMDGYYPVGAMATDVGVLIAFALVMFAIGMNVFKERV